MASTGLEFREDWPLPRAGPDQVLVRVGACGLNNTDVNTRTAWYSAAGADATTGEAPPGALAADAAWSGRSISFPRGAGGGRLRNRRRGRRGGRSVAARRRVLIDPWLRDWSAPHDRERCGYFGSERDGGFAEYTAAPVRNVHVIDSSLSDPELASFPTSWVTAENMLNRAGVGPQDRVLVTGASGGVGSALIQLAGVSRGADHRALRGRKGGKPSGPRGPITCSPDPARPPGRPPAVHRAGGG